MTPDQMGEYLEHQGASDDEIDEFLEHFGVKGMKWGVRREERLQATQRVAEGKGTTEDRKFVARNQSAVSLIRGRGLTGAAKADVVKLQALKDRTSKGEATLRDRLNYIGPYNMYNLGGPRGTKTPKPESKAKIDKGQSAANKNLKLVGKVAVGALAGVGAAAVAAKGLDKFVEKAILGL